MSQTHWSTVSVEQAHCSLALQARFHQQLGQVSLLDRVAMHQVRPLFTATVADKHLMNLEKQHAKFSHKVPNRVSGRHVFLQDCFAAHRSLEESPMSNPLRQRIMQAHAHLFQDLSVQERIHYDLRAFQRRRQAAEQHHHHLVDLSSQLELQQEQARIQQELETDKLPCRLINCKLSAHDLMTLITRLDLPQYLPARILERRRLLLNSPGVPDDQMQLRISSCLDHCFETKFPHDMPSWARALSRNKAAFHRTVLLLRHDEAEVCCLPVLIWEKPHYVVIAKLRRVAARMPNYTEFLQMKPFEEFECCDQIFELDGSPTMPAASLEVPDDVDVHVLPEVVFLRAGRCATLSAPVALQVFVGQSEWDSVRKRAHPRGEKEPKTAADADLIHEHPWIVGVLGQKRKSSSSMAGVAKKAAVTEVDPVSDEQLADAFSQLEAERRRWQLEDVGDVQSHFKSEIRGGKWTVEHRQVAFDCRQVAFDCLACKASSAVAIDFCKRYALPLMASWSHQKYGAHSIGILCRAWQHRVGFWMELWLESGSDDFEFELGHAEGYLESVATLPSSSPAWPRVNAICGLKPLMRGTGAASSSTA